MADLLGTISQQLGMGIFPDLKGRTSPLFIDGVNVTFENGYVKGGLENEVLFEPPFLSPILGMHTAFIKGVKTLFFATDTDLFQWDETNGIQLVTRLTGEYNNNDETPWQFIDWGDFVACTNGTDTPQLYDDKFRFRDLTGLGAITKADIIAVWSPYAFLMNDNRFNKNIDWCDTDNIENWIPGAISQAGTEVARGMQSAIKAAQPIGQSGLAIYSLNEMRLLNYLGSPLNWGNEPALHDIGAFGKQSVCRAHEFQYGLGPSGFWETDGSTSRILSRGVIHNFIFNNINQDMAYKACVYHDEIATLICAFYPSKNSTYNDRGIGYNYTNGSFTIFNYGRTAAAGSGVFPFVIVGNHDGSIVAQSAANSPIGVGGQKVLPMTPEAELVTGYGEFGFGEGGFGGVIDTDG